MTKAQARVLVADDQTMLRASLRVLSNNEPDLIVGEAATAGKLSTWLR